MGQIGYVLAQAMASVGCIAVPVITQVVVDPTDKAFRNPTKFVGPVCKYMLVYLKERPFE